MSTNLAYSLPVRRQQPEFEEETRPRRVQLVTTWAQRQARPKVAYALLAMIVLFAVFLAQLLLSIALSSGAYHIASLQNKQRDLGRVQSSLTEKLQTVGSTQNLAANAAALGMINTSAPAYLRLADGQVVGGKAEAAKGKAAKQKATGATGEVPNALLMTVPLLTGGSGHGTANTSKTATSDSQSTGGGSQSGFTTDTTKDTSTGASAGSPNPGFLPSPQTH
jgi:hypothetical protein